jgi:predicted nucleic acid-binding protein
MSRFLDTNVVVRYLTGDPADQAERTRSVIDSEEPLELTSVTLLETYFALENHYAMPREAILDALIDFTGRDNILTADAEKVHVVTGLGFCRGSRRVSCGDALIWASARSRILPPPAGVYSFDRRFPREGIDIVLL